MNQKGTGRFRQTLLVTTGSAVGTVKIARAAANAAALSRLAALTAVVPLPRSLTGKYTRTLLLVWD